MNLKNYEIVFITRESLKLPGARYRAYNIAQALERIGYKASVFSYSDDLGAFSGKLEKYLTLRKKIAYNKAAVNYLKNFQNPLFIIQRFNYHSIGPLLYALKNNINYIFDIDDWEFREDTGTLFGFWPKSKAEFVFKFFLKRAKLALTGSRFLFDYIKSINPRTFYFPPAISIEKFTLKNTPYEKKDNITLSWMGTMFREEDFLNLKFAFEVLKDIQKNNIQISLEIAGNGPWKNAAENEAEKSMLKNVMFKSWIPYEIIPEYLEDIDIGIFPIGIHNKFIQAKFPVKVLEFMAKGIPVIASEFGEVKEIISNQTNGLLAKDKDSFIQSLIKLSKDSSLRKHIGLNARKFIAAEFTLQKRALEFISIINNAE